MSNISRRCRKLKLGVFQTLVLVVDEVYLMAPSVLQFCYNQTLESLKKKFS